MPTYVCSPYSLNTVSTASIQFGLQEDIGKDRKGQDRIPYQGPDRIRCPAPNHTP